MNTETIYDVIVLGAGICGLSVAYKEKKAGKSVLIIEKSPTNGGVITTRPTEFGNFELGPNSFSISDETLSLLKELGLEKDIIYANDAAKKRYLFLNGKPTQINPKKLLFSSEIIGFKSKMKLLSERFKKPQLIEKETLANAIRRRFNDEILQTLVNPIISGIYAGDTEKLEYKSSMKKLYQYEKEYGSFTKGFLKSKKNGEARKVITFKNGLQQLCDALTVKLNDNFANQEITQIELLNDLVKVSSETDSYLGKQVIMCTPANITGQLIKPWDSKLANEISSIEYPPLLSIQLAFDKKQVNSHLDAFGLLIPKQAGKVTLGIINYSSLFDPNQSYHKYNLFVGIKEGINDDYISKLVLTAQNELKDIYKIEGDAQFINYKVWHRSIPQFNARYDELMKKVDAFEQTFPKISIKGNWRAGVAIGDCIQV